MRVALRPLYPGSATFPWRIDAASITLRRGLPRVDPAPLPCPLRSSFPSYRARVESHRSGLPIFQDRRASGGQRVMVVRAGLSVRTDASGPLAKPGAITMSDETDVTEPTDVTDEGDDDE